MRLNCSAILAVSSRVEVTGNFTATRKNFVILKSFIIIAGIKQLSNEYLLNFGRLAEYLMTLVFVWFISSVFCTIYNAAH